ncbi:hypothetical protein [Natronorarus salvus]|uniref:hypothetical protein n=1 Tax=Natronorarus salvus TaxID=3117733 RepID=UPI002F261057
MVDPVVGGLSSAIARAVIDRIREYVQQSDDPEEAWEEAVRECAITVRVAFRQKYEDPDMPDFKGLQQQAGQIGYVARDLAVRGELRGFDENLVIDVRSLATVYAEYVRTPTVRSGDDVINFREEFGPVNERILERTSPE